MRGLGHIFPHQNRDKAYKEAFCAAAKKPWGTERASGGEHFRADHDKGFRQGRGDGA